MFTHPYKKMEVYFYRYKYPALGMYRQSSVRAYRT